MNATQVIALRPDTDEPTPAELQAAARAAYLQAAAEGVAPTGAQLGHQFGRSDRWGRDRIAEARGATHRIVPAHLPGSGTPVGTSDHMDTTANSRHSNSLLEAERTDAGTPHSGGQITAVASDVHELTERSAGRRTTDARSPAGDASPAPGAWSRRLIRWITTAAVIVVAACAARSSYEHQRTVVEMAGEHRSAWYLPLVRHEALITMRVRDPPPVVAATGRS
jgi:hypothetical protein